MNELERIVGDVSAGTERLLATVVRVEGSSYRRPGARMLVAGERWMAGCVSGGCLEGDVMLRGRHRCKDGPVIVTYDSTKDAGDEVTYGLGCNGVVDILLEYIPPNGRNDALEFAAACFAREASGVLVTVIRSERPDVPVGARWSAPEVPFERPIADPVLRAAVCLPAGVTTIEGVTVLVEEIAPSPQLFILGSGHDAAPVASMAASVGFRATVADRAIREPSRFVRVAQLVREAEVPALIARAHEAYVVIMHHQESADREALAMALDSRAHYIGVLGPAKRTRELLADLGRTADGRVHAPIGLDIGAEAPEQIALAILGEVTAVRSGARAGKLRDRARALHGDIAIAVLAAGGSQRLGRPKQLVDVGGTPMIRHVASVCLGLGGGPVGIVTGANAAAVELALGNLRVARIANAGWPEGIASSIRAGVTWARSTGANALALVLGDQPRITVEHVRALRDAWLAGAPMAASRYSGILGAPAIFDRAKWAELDELTGDQGAGKLLYADSTTAIEWDGGALDVDTPADVDALARVMAAAAAAD